MTGDGMRLQKFLSRAGVASRRASEELIEQGRVRVDGRRVTRMGVRVDPRTSVVEVDGHRVETGPRHWLALHKPPGFLCTRSDPGGRPTVYDLLPEGPLRDLFHVGRLDFLSEGLLLLTNEGELAHGLLHPSSEVSRRYEVRPVPPVDGALVRRLLEGVVLEDGPASADTAALLSDPADGSPILLVTLHEGRNREIRRMLKRLGVGVCSLKRIAFGPVELGKLPAGDWRELESGEVAALRRVAGDGDARGGADGAA